VPTYDILDLDGENALRWKALVHRCIGYDVYHLPQYHRLSDCLGQGKPALFWYEEDDTLICFPLLIRDIDRDLPHNQSARALRDATSVYGYPGPLSNKSFVSPSVASRFHESLLTVLKERAIVNVFSRLNPIMSVSHLLDGIGAYTNEGSTISIDLAQPLETQYAQFRRSHRDAIEHLRSLSAICSVSSDLPDVATFEHMYLDAMERVKASSWYNYPSTWFRGFIQSGDSISRVFLANAGGSVLAGALVSLCNSVCQIHLACVAKEHAPLSPLKFVFDEVRLWACHKGASVVHMGGGIGARSDSLFFFKSGFSPRRHQYRTWQWVLDRGLYNQLVEDRMRQNEQRHKMSDPHFFPQYRAPAHDYEPLEEDQLGVIMPSVDNSQIQLDLSGISKSTNAFEPITNSREIRVHNGHPPGCGTIRRVVILGGGGHARVIADAIGRANRKRCLLELVGFLDDNPLLFGSTISGKRVLGSLRDVTKVPHDAIVLGIGENHRRGQVFAEMVSLGQNVIPVIHPSAIIAHDVRIGRGTVVCAGVIVNSGARIGENVILNTACTIGHDCRVDSHAHVAGGVHLGGGVAIGEGAFVGLGSAVVPNRAIGSWATVGAGAVVTREVASNITVVGIPARKLSK
jgi:sugar O-acyltransferase (sialic acid O-acetyltransferase NeuD family)